MPNHKPKNSKSNTTLYHFLTKNQHLPQIATIHTTAKFNLRHFTCVLSASNTKNDQLYHLEILCPLNRIYGGF